MVEWPGAWIVALEIRKIKKQYDQLGKSPKPYSERVRRERSLLWLDYGTKKDTYREISGKHFNVRPAIDVKEEERPAIDDLFTYLNGSTWSRNRGWTGRQKTLLRPEIKVLEAEASEYQGLIHGYHREQPYVAPHLDDNSRGYSIGEFSAYMSEKSQKGSPVKSPPPAPTQVAISPEQIPHDLGSVGSQSSLFSYSTASIPDIVAAKIEGIDFSGNEFMIPQSKAFSLLS
jgi:hypothetical protein